VKLPSFKRYERSDSKLSELRGGKGNTSSISKKGENDNMWFSDNYFLDNIQTPRLGSKPSEDFITMN
jgi:hypothetical protein